MRYEPFEYFHSDMACYCDDVETNNLTLEDVKDRTGVPIQDIRRTCRAYSDGEHDLFYEYTKMAYKGDVERKYKEFAQWVEAKDLDDASIENVLYKIRRKGMLKVKF